MPVLARTFEAAGLSTILVTPMPYWAERVGTPRTLAVEFPFGHTLGEPGNRDQQLRVIRSALKVLERANLPGEVHHSQERWPVAVEQAVKAWQPSQASPIVAELSPKFRQILREHRRRS